MKASWCTHQVLFPVAAVCSRVGIRGGIEREVASKHSEELMGGKQYT